MMTVHKIHATDAVGYADYLGSRSSACRRGDYYLGREGCQQEAPGIWHGRGAAELTLSGDVTRSDLLRTWEGRDPRSGEVAVRRAAGGEHVAAIDCTFSAPKSVSVAWALGDVATRDGIEAAHDRAVATALDHIEEHVPLVRRRVGGEIVHEHAAGIVAARFRHHTSRLSAEQHANGEAPDPQLHDHVAVANMALRHSEAAEASGRWAAVDSRELYRVAAEAGAVYRAELAAGLQRLGFQVHREGRYVEIDGISEAVRRAFSARAVEVEEATQRFVENYGRRPTDKEAKDLTVRSRQPKSAEHGPAFDQWRERGRAAGIARSDISTLRSGVHADRDPQLLVADVVHDLTDPPSPFCITTTTAIVDERHLRIAAAEAAQGRIPGVEVGTLIAAVQASPEMVLLNQRHWTTRDMLRAEDHVRDAARHLAGLADRGLPGSVVQAAIDRAQVQLTAEQRTVVRQLCGPRAIGLLSAPAGAGKGEVLRAVTQAHQAAGHRVIALAAAGETAQRLASGTGADTAATIDAFIRRVDGGRLAVTRDDVVVLDEAALVETRRWRELLRCTGPATVIAAGDAEQLSPIEAGGMWRLLEREVGVHRLTENFRARDAWARDAWSALREGRSTAALDDFAARGQVHFADNRAAARDAAVEIWDQQRQAGLYRNRGVEEFLLLTDGSNLEVDALNRAAQARRLGAGELGGRCVEVEAPHSGRTTLRRERVFLGDRVVLQRRLYDSDGRPRAENGATGAVIGVDADAQRLTLDLDGRATPVANEELAAVRLGYARHVYSAQGRTVDCAVVVTGGWQTDRRTSYVGVSRARESSHVVSDYSSLDVEPGDRSGAMRELAERMAVSREKIAATELLPSHLEGRPSVMPDGARERGPDADAQAAAGQRYRSLATQRVLASPEPLSLAEDWAARHEREAERQRREQERELGAGRGR